MTGPATRAVDQDVVPGETGDALDALAVVDGDPVLDEVADADAGAAAVQMGDDGALAKYLPPGQHGGPRGGAPRVEVGDGEVGGGEEAGGDGEGADGVAQVGVEEAGRERGGHAGGVRRDFPFFWGGREFGEVGRKGSYERFIVAIRI